MSYDTELDELFNILRNNGYEELLKERGIMDGRFGFSEKYKILLNENIIDTSTLTPYQKNRLKEFENLLNTYIP